jgi:predicted Zn-dependent peptidase
MVVSVAGDCTHDAVAADLERRFAGTARVAPPRPGRRPGPRPSPSTSCGAPTEQAHVVYGMRSVSRFDERRWALAVLNHVLGGGLSSRLFQKVREERGLAYSVWSERAAYQDAGSLAVVVGTAPEHVDEVLQIVPPSSSCWPPTASPTGSWPWPRGTCGPRCCSRARTRGPA